MVEGLFDAVVRQAWAEVLVRARRVRFREHDNARAVAAYRAMSAAELEGVNARQRWANERVIPRTLAGRLPERACVAVDLCCGVGDSTEVLCRCLPRGSRVLGLDCSEAFVTRARGRVYLDAEGREAAAAFRVQSVLEEFRGEDGERLPDASVDLVNACGSLAVNFDPPELGVLARELRRVLRPGGLAALDAPASGAGKARLIALMRRAGFSWEGGERSCWLDRFCQLRFRRSGATATTTPPRRRGSRSRPSTRRGPAARPR